jgi:hypothetical protein
MTEDRDLVKRLRSVGRLRPHNFTATPQERAAEATEEALRLEAAARIEALERERDEAVQYRKDYGAAAIQEAIEAWNGVEARAAAAHRAGMLEAARIVEDMNIEHGPDGDSLAPRRPGNRNGLAYAAAIRAAADASPAAPGGSNDTV